MSRLQTMARVIRENVQWQESRERPNRPTDRPNEQKKISEEHNESLDCKTSLAVQLEKSVLVKINVHSIENHAEENEVPNFRYWQECAMNKTRKNSLLYMMVLRGKDALLANNNNNRNSREKNAFFLECLGKLTITIAKHLSSVLCSLCVSFLEWESEKKICVFFSFYRVFGKCIDPIFEHSKNASLKEKSSENAFIFFFHLVCLLWYGEERWKSRWRVKERVARKSDINSQRKRLINENLLHDFGSARRQWPTYFLHSKCGILGWM